MRTFFQHPKKPFFVRELTRILETQINAVRREIELLVDIGIIHETTHTPEADDLSGGTQLRKYYILNIESILYPELHALLLKGTVLGQEAMVEALKDKAGDIQLLLLTGRFTDDKRANTDILIVGDVDERAVARIIAQYEKEFGFDIRYTVMTELEFADRRHVMDKFLYSLFEAAHVVVVDKLKK